MTFYIDIKFDLDETIFSYSIDARNIDEAMTCVRYWIAGLTVGGKHSATLTSISAKPRRGTDYVPLIAVVAIAF